MKKIFIYIYLNIEIQAPVNFLCDIMKIEKFNGFDKNGNLPPGIYNMTLTEVEKIFSKNKTPIRNNIMHEYKKHFSELKNTGYFLDHWIGGSFITTELNPNDIDTLTEFNGCEIEKNNDKTKIDNIINNSKLNTNGLCHSLKIYKYPPSDERYSFYLKTKLRILIEIFGSDREGKSKGIVHLIN